MSGSPRYFGGDAVQPVVLLGGVLIDGCVVRRARLRHDAPLQIRKNSPPWGRDILLHAEGVIAGCPAEK